MPTQIQVILVKEEKATPTEIKALLNKIYDFADNEGYDVKHQTTSIS